MYKICIFAGTTEARRLVELLSTQRHVAVTACVATEYGETLLPDTDNVTVRSGRIPVSEIIQLLSDTKYDLVIDATHPYAASITESVARACAETGTEYLRLLREASEQAEDTLCVADAEEAAALLSKKEGNILLTTGSKELVAFEGVEKERLYVRVLPSKEALDLCEKAQIPHSHILALQGPFTTALNIALMEQYHIGILVTKDGGKKGGFLEKQEAARLQKAALVVIGRPTQEEGYSVEEAWNLVLESLYAKGDAGGYAQVEDNAASGRAKLSTAVEQELCVYGTKGGAVE